MVSLTLPYPPSVNRLWRPVKGSMIKTDAYRAWQEEAGWALLLARQKGISGPYDLALVLHRPDNRIRDLDNLFKPVSDLLVKHNLIEGDHLAQRVTAEWGEDVEGGSVDVTVTARALTPRKIVQQVADKHHTTVADLKGPSRMRIFAWPRQEAMWRLRRETIWSLPKIGAYLGGRDHTTVLHGIRRYEARQAA